MDWGLMGRMSLAVFLAELGDKTQLAVIAASAAAKDKLAVLVGSAAALVVSTVLAVLVGGAIGMHPIVRKYGHIAAGVAFIILGVIFLASGLKSPRIQ